MTTLAYLRVSTDDQEQDRQKVAIVDYARRRGIKIDEWIEIKISSRKSLEKRRVEEVVDRLGDDDTLIVADLSRLGRSTVEIILTVDALLKNGVHLICVKEGLDIHGEMSLASKITVSLFGIMAEFTRDTISTNTKEGLAAARAKGKVLGRPKGQGKSKLDGKEEEIRVLIQKTIPAASIAKLLDVHPNTLRHFIKTRNLG